MLTYSKADDPNVPKTCTDRAIKEHFKIPVIMTPTKKRNRNVMKYQKATLIFLRYEH